MGWRETALKVLLHCMLAFSSRVQSQANDSIGTSVADNDNLASLSNHPGVGGSTVRPTLRTGCLDFQGQRVEDGEKYVPSPTDICTKCTCELTFPVRCHSVACSPPHHCARPHALKGSCCEYICLDDSNILTNGTHPGDRDGTGDGESITNLSLRLIASTVTSFLVLALLLFMVHRLRQRRLLLAMRRFEARSQQVHSEDTDSEAYIPDMFMTVECPPYTDPPPPYSPPKPPQILPGEQPPPYEELNQNSDTNGTSADENRNQMALSLSQSRVHEPSAMGMTPLAGVGMSGGTGRGVLRSSVQQETSFNTQCREIAGPRPGRGSDDTQIERQMTQQRSSPAETYNLGLREDGAQNGCGPMTCDRANVTHSLPAYASTDIVGGLGLVFSSREDPTRNSAAAGMEAVASARWREFAIGERGQPEGASVSRGTAAVCGSVSQNEPHFQHRRRVPAARRGSFRAQTLPAATAFQRFSNLFKRGSWRAKNRRRVPPRLSFGGGVSELRTGNVPAQYSTLPRAERRNFSSGRFYAGFDLSACNFYPTTASPSSSSSNSSSGAENVASQSQVLQQSGNAFPSNQHEHPHLWAGSPRDQDDLNNQGSIGARNHFMFHNSSLASHHREQFQDDLRRHLPPVCGQSYDSGELPARPSTYPGEAILRGDLREEPQVGQPPPSVSDSVTVSQERTFPPTSHSGSETGLASANVHPEGTCVSLQSSPHFYSQAATGTVPDPQRSLASFMCSNLPMAAAAQSIREQSTKLYSTPLNTAISTSNSSISLANDATTFQSSNSNISSQSKCINAAELLVASSSGSTQQPHHHTLDSMKSGLNHQPHHLNQSWNNKSSQNSSYVNVARNDAGPGAIRRSHSDTSEGSLLSVCSETGEQKLRATRNQDVDGCNPSEVRVLPADGQYPLHPSLESHQPSGLSSVHDNNYGSLCDRISQTHHFGEGVGSDISSAILKEVQSELGAFGGRSPPPEQLIQGESLSAGKFSNDKVAASYTDSMHEPNYNLNTSPHTRKRLASKDLLPVVREDQTVKSVKISPLGIAHVTSQSSIPLDPATRKLGDLPLPSSEEVAPVRGTPAKSADISKKRRKKSTARSSSSPLFFYLGNAKQKKSVLSNSWEKTETLQKAPSKAVPQDKDIKNGKGISKRRVPPRTYCPPLPIINVDPSNKLMTHSSGDAVLYGNADMHQGGAWPLMGNAQHPAYGQFTQEPGDVINIGVANVVSSGSDVNNLSGMNDVNMPFRKLWEAGEGNNSLDFPPVHAMSANGQQRRRSGSGQHSHRRQASAGSSPAGLPVSPARRKPRPKSLAAPGDTGRYEKHHNSPAIDSLRMNHEVGQGRGGARSGFGRDMNLDDENGIADFHIHTISSNPQKNTLGYAAVVGTALLPSKQAHKSDGCASSDLGASRGPVLDGPHWGGHAGAHTSSKSGPSKELLFTGRPPGYPAGGVGGQRSKKHQSRPTFQPCTSEPYSQGAVEQSKDSVARKELYNQLPRPVIRGISRTVSEEDVREATSYV